NQATNKMKNIRGVAGQLGYQIQDIAVQLQMGQNAFMVFVQQGSQILSILGPMGAVAGAVLAISGAMAGALLPSLVETTEASEVLATAQKNLNEVVTQTESGVS
ncbi:phage tail length tape measure family protein, partial [Glaesserella parasuis]|uniref:phage tail length tape measure family protein n=1 Tax=Glaesserella parasuis TaxID=738 RepID=UPI0027174A75|nr:phage tail length tape measure family protein [Glaesserella parasuis]